MAFECWSVDNVPSWRVISLERPFLIATGIVDPAPDVPATLSNLVSSLSLLC